MILNVFIDWLVASTCLELCVLGQECIAFYYFRKYVGLRVEQTIDTEKTYEINLCFLIILLYSTARLNFTDTCVQKATASNNHSNALE